MELPFLHDYYPKAVALADGSEYYVWEEPDAKTRYRVMGTRRNVAGTKYREPQRLSDEDYAESPFPFRNGDKLVLLYQTKDPVTHVVTNIRKESADRGDTWVKIE